MPEALSLVFTTTGLAWVLLATALAGFTYGYAGFGAALIFMPVAAAFLPPEDAVLAMSFFGISSALVVLPQAVRDCERRMTSALILSAIVALPVGTYLLKVVEVDLLRVVIAVIAMITLGILMAGVRLKTAPRLPAWLGVGAASGAIGGATGLTGPVMILFQLAGQGSAAQIRANSIAFLTILGLSLFPSMLLQGMVTGRGLLTAAVLVPLYMLATYLGKRCFRPDFEQLYRKLAYGLIALAALRGIPWERFW